MSGSSSNFNGVHDQTYYFKNITFQVEGILFCVPRHHFMEQSEVFRDMFELPVASDAVPDGLSDGQPLRLEGVSVADFRQLLRVMFPSRPMFFGFFTVSQWTSVLRLSAMWQMNYLKMYVLGVLPRLPGSREDWTALLDLSVEHQLPEVRTIAIKKITATFQHPSDTFTLVAMARKYQVRSWFKTGLQQLIERSQFLSDADEETLGWRTIFKLSRLREDYVRDRHDSSYSSQLSVEREFEDELRTMNN